MQETTEVQVDTANGSGEGRSQEDTLIFSFPEGIPGFTNAREFELFPLGLEFGPYLGFRCTSSETPLFVVVQPSAVISDYVVEIDDDSQMLLGVHSAEEVLVLLIVTLNGPGRLPVANLAAPLVINHRTKIGFQVIMPDSNLDMRYKLGTPVHDPNRALVPTR